MKSLLLVGALIFLVSCGKNPVGEFGHHLIKDLGTGIEAIGQVPRNIARTVLLGDDKKDDSLDKETLARLEEAEKKAQEALDKLGEEIDRLKDDISELYKYVGDLNHDQDKLEQEILNLTSQVAELESYEYISEFIDPCGDLPNVFDELILKTSTGRLIAYFESSSVAFLAELTDGVYRTTDAQRCKFEIVGGEIVSEILDAVNEVSEKEQKKLDKEKKKADKELEKQKKKIAKELEKQNKKDKKDKK